MASSTMDSTITEYRKMFPREADKPFVQFLFTDEFVTALTPAALKIALASHVTPQYAIEEFRRFIALKVFTQDRYASKISPSPLMDSMWHAAILDTEFYSVLQDACGSKLQHRPQGADDSESEQRVLRLQAMENLYSVFFTPNQSRPSIFTTVPLAGSVVETAIANRAIQSGAGSSSTQVLAKTFPIVVRAEHHGLTQVFNVQAHSGAKVESLKQQILTKTGVLPEMQRLLFDWEKLDDSRTIDDYDIESKDEITMYLEQMGC